jgi:hypothetical protein
LRRAVSVTVINPALVNHQGLSGGEPSLMIQNEDIAELVALAVTLPPRTTLYEATLYDATGE